MWSPYCQATGATMGNLDELFADLLTNGDRMTRPTPGDIGDNGDKQAVARLAARFDAGDTLATSGDISGNEGAVSPNVASMSPPANRPQSEQRRGLSPGSPMSPPSEVHEPSPRPYRLTRSEANRCHWPVWSEPEIQAFSTRVLTFMRRGVNPTDADDLAERLTLRDRDSDELRLCLECQHYRSGRCGNHRAAGLNSPELGRDLAAMLQRCPGFACPVEGLR